jgi:hypothetical protein
MFTIVLNIPIVINDINTAGEAAKGEKAGYQQFYLVELKKLSCEERWNKEEEVLGPMSGS